MFFILTIVVFPLFSLWFRMIFPLIGVSQVFCALLRQLFPRPPIPPPTTNLLFSFLFFFPPAIGIVSLLFPLLLIRRLLAISVH